MYNFSRILSILAVSITDSMNDEVSFLPRDTLC